MNTVKTFSLMLVLSGILLVAGAIIGGESGILFALIIALGMNFFAYWSSDRIALGMTHARKVTEQEEPELHNLVGEQARHADLPMPKVYIIENESPNAFATGRNPKHATIAVTTGIRQILSREELGAVLAHEMAHVGNRDTLIMTMVATIAGAISLLALFAQFAAFFGGRRGAGGLLGLLVMIIVMPLAAAVVRMAISRTREYQADATGARTSGNPHALASALGKLEQGSQIRPMKIANGASHLFIVNPLRGKSMANLFSTHPPIEERIRRLRQMTLQANF
jgi:heat shock protein HtpX